MKTLVLAVFCVLCLVGWAGDSRADADSIDRILARFSDVEALSAHFREEKRMALLKAPLVSEGYLYYQRPHSLVRHTRSPFASSLLLAGTSLSFGRGGDVQSVSLETQPAVSILVDAFVGVLSGDRKALERAANLTLELREGDRFHLVITPTREPLTKLVRVIELDGQANKLTGMRLVDQSGDETLTVFTQVMPRAAFSEGEQKRLFRIGG